jgi:hypothetical protein
LPNKGLTDESPLEKLERLLAPLESNEDDSAIAKNDRLIAKALADDDQTADLNLIPVKHIREFAKFVGIESGEPDSYDKLRKRATKSDVERFLATPVPPRCAGPGIPHLSNEQIRKLAPMAAGEDAIAKIERE